jgi:hypothetical protein
MTNAYKGKIVSVIHPACSKITTIGFCPDDDNFKGLLLYITYKFNREEDKDISESLSKIIEDRLKKVKDLEGISAEISLDASLNRDTLQYYSTAPVRFL